MENPNFGASIDLLQLNGAVLIESSKTKGELILCIPITPSKLKTLKRENGLQSCYLNVFGLGRNDRYGNNYMLTRSLTKEESDYNATCTDDTQKVRGEILGNAKYIGHAPAAPTATAQDTGIPENDDLPF